MEWWLILIIVIVALASIVGMYFLVPFLQGLYYKKPEQDYHIVDMEGIRDKNE